MPRVTSHASVGYGRYKYLFTHIRFISATDEPRSNLSVRGYEPSTPEQTAVLPQELEIAGDSSVVSVRGEEDANSWVGLPKQSGHATDRYRDSRCRPKPLKKATDVRDPCYVPCQATI